MATSAILDTSAYSHIGRSNPRLVSLIKDYERLVLPLNVVAELRSGYRLGSMEQENIHVLDLFLSQTQVGLAIADEITLEHYVTLYEIARRHGKTLSHNDLWIAALAQQLGYDLVTFDKDFAVFGELFGERLHILPTPK